MTSSATYRVMQYNVTHQKHGWTVMTELFEIPLAKRGENVASVIRDVAPHILCLAERHNEWAGIVDADAMDGAVRLSDLLEGSCNAVADDYMACGDTQVANRVPIFYDPKTFKRVDSGILKLTEEYPFERSENKRTVSWLILEDISDTENRGQKVAVFNTHWSIMEYKGRSFAEIRATQSREMQELINSEKFADMPRIVCGDFNAGFNDTIYRELIENCQLSDADWTVNGKLTWNSVDHISASDDVTFQSYSVKRGTVLASDHPPIFADFTVNS